MAELISRTGRVQSWLDDPDGRLPVSCTVFVVDDTMEGPKASKPRGASPHMLSATEQAVQSTSPDSAPKATIMAKGLLPLVLSRSGKSILL